MMNPKRITQSTSGTAARQFSTIQLTFRAIVSATRHAPSVMKNAVAFARLVIFMGAASASAIPMIDEKPPAIHLGGSKKNQSPEIATTISSGSGITGGTAASSAAVNFDFGNLMSQARPSVFSAQIPYQFKSNSYHAMPCFAACGDA